MTSSGGAELMQSNEFGTPSRADANQFAVPGRLAMANSATSPSGAAGQNRNSAEQTFACNPLGANQSSRQQQQQQQQRHWSETVPLDSASSTASEADNQLDNSHNDADQPNQKPHVGPMGIFFKVWSLVKVTKSRHSRMKRQMGELNAGHQFRFMSGEQFGGGAPPAETSAATPRGNQQQQRGVLKPTLLQDSHFKRAGSQPPPSSHLNRRGLEPLRVGQPTLGANAIATGTASSSSGLSSTTSSTLATNYATPNWATRIQRATPPNSANNHQRASPPVATLAAEPNREELRARPHQLRAQSDSSHLEELRKRAISAAKSSKPALMAAAGGQKPRISFRRLRRRLRQHSVSDDTGDEEEDEEEDEDEVEQAESRPKTGPNQDKDDDELDSDLNEIYSTPNDSIQSVPNGQPMRIGAEIETNGKTNKPIYKLTKSFSTNFFSSQSNGDMAKGIEIARARRGGSDEPKRVGLSCRSPISEGAHEGAETNRTKVTTTSSSRFFISSSSSEDSNPSQQSSVQTSIPIRPALHYHGPARPNSLLLAHSINSNNLPSLLTPSTLLISGGVGDNMDHEASLQLNQRFLGANPSCRLVGQTLDQLNDVSQYKKSPSLFDMKPQKTSEIIQRFSSKYPRSSHMSSFVPQQQAARPPLHLAPAESYQLPARFSMSNSISLHDCKLTSFKPRDQLFEWPLRDVAGEEEGQREAQLVQEGAKGSKSEYKLAQMLLELGSNPGAKDEFGCTALMHAINSENLAAFKCLIEHGVDLNETNDSGQSALDLICEKPANETRLEMLKLMIDNQVDLDRNHKRDNSRLLDRLIDQHKKPTNDKSHYIDSLLHNGAKLGSATWLAAQGKHEIQLKLLRKLCQDGYYLYKKLSIEAAVFRFEYALKRINELDQQLAACRQSKCYSSKCRHLFGQHQQQQLEPNERQFVARESQQVKYQTFLGLSRCERKRGFFKRALEFANMSILIDSASYEGYYSKAHILKDIGEKAEAFSTIDQAERLVSKSLELIKKQLNELDVQEESLVFDTCFNMHEPNKLNWIESTRLELVNNLDYLTEAKRHITRMRNEIEAGQ